MIPLPDAVANNQEIDIALVGITAPRVNRSLSLFWLEEDWLC